MKKLVRSRSNQMLAGVLGGLADYFNKDVSVVRIIFVLVLIFTGFFPFGILYFVAMLLIPKEESY